MKVSKYRSRSASAGPHLFGSLPGGFGSLPGGFGSLPGGSGSMPFVPRADFGDPNTVPYVRLVDPDYYRYTNRAALRLIWIRGWIKLFVLKGLSSQLYGWLIYLSPIWPDSPFD